jgi:integrase
MAFVRVGQFKAKKGSADELCRTYSAEAIPAIRAAKGNAGALLLREQEAPKARDRVMSGHVRQRGKKGQWYAVIDVFVDGKRKRRWHTLENCNGKREAERACAALIAKQAERSYVAPAKVIVAEFVRSRIDQWEAAGNITARTAQRYRQLLDNQITPHLGTKSLQKVTRLDIEGWHTAFRNSGLAARTIGYAHRVLGKALRDAEKDNLIVKNATKLQRAPKVTDEEMVIVRDVPALVDKLAGFRLRIPAMVALFTGMRLGEILALRWNRIDLDKGALQVREALEQTKEHGVRFKPPKSKAGRRDITVPDILIGALREHHKATLELRMQLGAGRLPDDALLSATIEGEPLSPNAQSAAWADFADSIGMPDVTFHALRHTHASQLIDAGVD